MSADKKYGNCRIQSIKIVNLINELSQQNVSLENDMTSEPNTVKIEG